MAASPALAGKHTASLRQLAALADPFPRRFGKVHPGLQVPIAACALQVTVPAILGLIYLGSPNLFLSAFQLTTIVRTFLFLLLSPFTDAVSLSP